MKRKENLKALPQLIEAATTIFNPQVEKAKDEGRNLVGFLYPEMPEEILTAAGCVPIYIHGAGSEGTEFADAFFKQLTCNYTRNTFNQILDGQYDFLDGAVIYNVCDHARRIFDNWQAQPDNPAYHFLYVPKARNQTTEEFYRKEIDKFIKATEEKFGVEITSEKLAQAIRLHNRVRRLQQEIYKLQEGKAVYLTGEELLMTMLAGVCMPREDYILLLEELLGELKANNETFEPEIRLLYAGGHADNPEYFKLFESTGASVVADNAEFGTRACDVLISEEGDPLEAIIDYYFNKKPASTRRIETQDSRLERVDELIKRFNVDGVIVTRLVMCDIWAFEQFMLRKHLSGKVPMLELEIDYIPDGEGQIRTRVQAFTESIRDRK